MRWLPLLLCLATPVAAEVPDRETLEEPGRIWIRDTLHPSAELGLVVPFFSYVKFEDGAFEDVFAAYADVIFPPSCEGVFPCDVALKAAPIFSGRYDLGDNGITLSDITRSPLVFDRAESALMIQADSFSRGETNPVLAMKDGALERTTPNGPVRYVAASETDMADILGLVRMFEVSIGLNYDCMVNGHLARANAAAPDALATSLLAMARLGAHFRHIADRKGTISKNGTIDSFDLPEAEKAAYAKLQIEEFGLRFLSVALEDSYATARAGDDTPPLPDLPVVADLIPAGLLASLPEDDQTDVLERVAEKAETIRQALPALYAAKADGAPYGEPTALLCHGL